MTTYMFTKGFEVLKDGSSYEFESFLGYERGCRMLGQGQVRVTGTEKEHVIFVEVTTPFDDRHIENAKGHGVDVYKLEKL